LPAYAKVIRAMPNTPALVGSGASVFAVGSKVTEEDAVTARRLLSAVGLAEQVPEKWIDPVTGLSGSGPAYVSPISITRAAMDCKGPQNRIETTFC